MGTCIECNKRHPDFYCPIESQFEGYYKAFFNAFLDSHAVVCKYQDCVCRSKSFMKMINAPVLKNSKRYGKLINEILMRDKSNYDYTTL
jgi:hypothetical protein